MNIQDRILVFQAIADVVFRTVLTIIGAGLWVYLTVALVRHPGISYAAGDSFLSMTVGVMFKYYFWHADPPKQG